MLGEVLAQVIRSGAVESLHTGHFVALNSDGSIFAQKGDPTLAIYPRSSLKSIQALAMVKAGLDLEPRLLALVCASHSGTQVHQSAVLEILAKADVNESALMCIEDRPLDEVLRRNVEPTRLAMNCSGKHAGMILTSVINGWPIDSYMESSHPLQLAIKAEVEAMSGEAVSLTSIDGCGAPLFMLSLLGLARAIQKLTNSIDPLYQSVLQACRQYPEMVSGYGRLNTKMMQDIPGLFMKDGAEAVNVASLLDGRTFAIKISDGGQRALPAVTVAILNLFGIQTSDSPEIVYGGGKNVGEIRATF